MKTLLCITINRPKNKMSKKMKQLAVLALIFSQNIITFRTMVPGNIFSTARNIIHGQENTQQDEQNRTIPAQETTITTTTTTTTTSAQERTTTTTTTPHQEERVTGHRRSHSTAFPEENQNSAQPVLTRPRITEHDELNPNMKSEDGFFFKNIETIAQNQNNLTDSEILKESVNAILSLSSLNKSYRSYLDTLLENYANGEQDQATRGIKVMRYILSRAYPELQEKIILLTTLEEGSDLVKLLAAIDALTNEEIQRGNLLRNDTRLGKLYNEICSNYSDEDCVAAKKFFDKIKEAFNNNQRGLQQFLLQSQDSHASFDVPTQNNNYKIITIFLNTLEAAFDHNQIELERSLSDRGLLENYFYAKVEEIVQDPKNLINPEALSAATDKIISLLKNKNYDNFLNKLLTEVCTAEEKDQITLHIKVMRYISGKAYPVLRDEVFSLNSCEEACNLIKLLNDIDTLTNESILRGFIFGMKNIDVNQVYSRICGQSSYIATTRFFDKVKKVSNNNQTKLREALTKTVFYIPLHRVVAELNHDDTRLFIFVLQEAFTDDLVGLQRALTQQDNYGDTALHRAVEWNNNPEVMRVVIASLQQAFTGNSQGLQDALIQRNNHGRTPLHLASQWGNSEVIKTLLDSLEKAFVGSPQGLQDALIQKNNYGRTPLHLAVERNNTEVIKTLFDSLQKAFAGNLVGLQVALTRQDNNGITPLHLSVVNDNDALIDILKKAFNNNQVELQFALTRQDNVGRTPLHLAVVNNNDALIDILKKAFNNNQVELQAALIQQDNNGRTPLHYATVMRYDTGFAGVIIASLQQAFDGNQQGLQDALTQQDNTGYTPLYYATRNFNQLSTRLIQAAINQVEAAINAQEENQ